jgi:hypothetical protein
VTVGLRLTPLAAHPQNIKALGALIQCRSGQSRKHWVAARVRPGEFSAKKKTPVAPKPAKSGVISALERRCAPLITA